MSNKEKRVCLAAFAGAHGVRGEVKLKTFTANEEDAAAYGPLSSENGARHFTLKIVRVLKPGLALARAPEIKNREDAQALAGTRLYAPRAALPAIEDEDEFYHEDLVGLEAFDPQGAPMGLIGAVHNFGAGDILELKDRPDGAPSVMVPFTKEAAPDLDLAAGRITIVLTEDTAVFSDETGEIVSTDLDVDLHAMREEDA
ncbi:MAG: ribosome maturation factor RimM [Amphiplicatus sp.]